jgi:hypothetical protein
MSLECQQLKKDQAAVCNRSSGDDSLQQYRQQAGDDRRSIHFKNVDFEKADALKPGAQKNDGQKADSPPNETPKKDDRDNFPHPKNIEEAVREGRTLELMAQDALRSTDTKAAAEGGEKIADILKQMTPSERALVLSQLQKWGDLMGDGKLRKPGVQSLPKASVELDEKGAAKGISFESVSDDNNFGKTLKLDLRRDKAGSNSGS